MTGWARALTRPFDADRATLLTELVLGAVKEFAIDCSELHADSTSVTFSGAYRGAGGTPRGGTPAAAITYGHDKDHRPDLKQLVWTLTVAADGAVPVAYRVDDGNTSDDVTHVPVWDALRRCRAGPTSSTWPIASSQAARPWTTSIKAAGAS
jgi:transposase